MDPLIDPFGTPDIAVNPNPDPSTFATLKGQWDQFLADPKGRGALASFGLALMQPVGVGQSTVGHVGQAIGNAGEAVQEANTRDQKQSEAESKAALREARATAAETRAGAAQSRAETAAMRAGAMGDRLGFQQRDIEAKNERNRLSNLLRAQSQYQQYVANTQKQNDNPLRTLPQEPILGFKEWVARNPALATGLRLDTGQPPPSGGQIDQTDVPPTDSGDSTDTVPPTPSVDEGTIIRNPKTGERRKLQNGKWVPL